MMNILTDSYLTFFCNYVKKFFSVINCTTGQPDAVSCSQKILRALIFYNNDGRFKKISASYFMKHSPLNATI